MIHTFIISYNRLTFLKQVVEALVGNPALKLHIVDNGSTYPPLLEYLNNVKHCQVYMLPQNEGHTVVWKKGLSHEISPNSPYIVTDNDCLPEDDFFLDTLQEGLEYPDINKVGLGLRLTDIPDANPHKEKIIKHEKSFAPVPVGEKFVRMPVDTTFALYRAGYHNYSAWGSTSNSDRKVCRCLRTTQTLAKHLSWYMNPKDFKTEEYKFYFNSMLAGSTHWSAEQSGWERRMGRKVAS